MPASMQLAWYVQAAKRLGELILKGEGPDLEVLGAAADKCLEKAIPFQLLLSPDPVDDAGGERSAGDPHLEDESIPDALDSMIAAEEAEGRIASLLSHATPQQGEILSGLLAKLKEGFSEAEAREAVAEDLGIVPSTVRVHLYGLRKMM